MVHAGDAPSLRNRGQSYAAGKAWTPMNATEHDIDILLKLQEVDRRVASAQKEFDALPHRKAILEVRAKRDEVFKKKVQVQDLFDDAEGRLASLVQEDEQLSQKQDEITALLAEVQGDYRAVTAQTRELDGVRKRRDRVMLETGQVEEEVNRISPVMKQIMQALDALDEKEADLVKSFQKAGGSLRAVIAKGEEMGSELRSQLDAELLRAYEQTQGRCGAVVVARLEDDACGACRANFDQSRMSKIRSQAPIAVCPACGRLLVV